MSTANEVIVFSPPIALFPHLGVQFLRGAEEQYNHRLLLLCSK